MIVSASGTLLDALQVSFRDACGAGDGIAPPVALLWTDPTGQWQPLLDPLRTAVPELYTLGPLAPEDRQGPVLWLKCVVDRTLPDVAPDEGNIPILYLPKVGRQDLRAGGNGHTHLQPLVELQFRGAVWHQRNGRDWTVEAFLTSEDALGLDVAQDTQTREAMLRALPDLAGESLATLRGRRLDAGDFDNLSIGDPVRDLLTWMSGAEAFESRSGGDRWTTFREVCVREFKFDPDDDGVPSAATALLQGGGKWDEVWKRFCDAPGLYRGISDALRAARPSDLLSLADHSRRPGLNEEHEDKLRAALEDAVDLPHSDACVRIDALDQEHQERRGWVWAEIGESPLAVALEPLGHLARATRQPLGGPTIDTVVEAYVTHGWRCDQAALNALSCLPPGAQSGLVQKAVRALYAPWLDQSARLFQDLLSADGAGLENRIAGVAAEPEVCVLFVDGLRFDLAAELCERLEAQGKSCRLEHRLAPIPTVTATAKPMASPAHKDCVGGDDVTDFYPLIRVTTKPANAAQLRASMAQSGVDVLEKDDIRMGVAVEQGGWSEVGKIDEYGHALNADLVRQIDVELDAIAVRVDALLAAGWGRVRVVTDHGWLLLPGGLPKVELPPSTVESKWARCALVQGESRPSIPTYPWHWNPTIQIASPPGIGAFRSNVEYTHGGVSLQECVVPDLFVERGAAAIAATINSVTWRGMRCRVDVDTSTSGLTLELRQNWKQAESSISAPKALDETGEASIAVADDSFEGAAAAVVVLDRTGRILDHRPTTVGEDA